jgi:PAS domain S-box-containing protein
VTEQIKTRKKVAELEALEASILESIPHAVIGLRDRHIIFANDGVQTVFGWRANDLIGRKSRIFYRTDEDDERIARELYSTLEKQKTFSTEFPCRRKNGRYITCRVTVSRIGETLKNKNIVITYEDITERKQVEDAYETMASKSQAGVYVVQDGLFVFVNSNAAHYVGFSVDQMIGMNSLSLVHPDDREMVKRNSQRMIQGRRFTPHEFRVVTRRGDIRWIMETVNLIPYRGRKAILGNSMDITELILARKKLAELEALEASILEAIPHAVIGLQNRRIIFVNDGVKSVFGFTSAELIDKSTRLLYRTDRDYERIAGMLYSLLERQTVVSIEFPCRRKDGEDIECMISAARIGRKLEEKRVVITYENITDRKRAEREVEQSRGQLRKLSAHLQSVREKERTRIARELHDELGQLLTALNTEIILLKNKIPDGQKILADKAQSMSALVDMTMQTVKKIYMDLRPGMLDHLGLTAALGWQADDFSKRTGIACKASFKPEDIVLDPDLTTTIFRIFQETLTNISRHAGATKVTVKLKVTDERLEFVVKDNGKGIEEKQMQKPDSFGLLGIRERVYHWDGRVNIVGKSGKGTKVTVIIPLRKSGEKT